MGLVAALGIIAGARLANADLWVLAVALLGGLLILVALTRDHVRVLCATLLIGFLAGSAAAVILREPTTPPYAGNGHERTTMTVISDPAQNPRGYHARVRWTDAQGIERTSFMLAGAWPRFHRGDTILATTRAEGINADSLIVSSLVVERHAATLEEQRSRLRNWLDGTVRGTVGGSEGALALGLLIGDDSAMTRHTDDAVRRAGLSHITAVSGWNVTLVVASVGALLLALGLRGPGWVTIEVGALAGYIWLVGADPPVIRAAIMGGFVIAARQLGRPAHGPSLIALAAALMIATDPSALSSLSFHLSILATAALIASLRYTARWSGLRAVVLTPMVATAAITLATAPAFAVTMGTISLVSIPANVLAGPLVPLAAAGGALIVATAWLPAIQVFVAAVTWYLTHLILWIAETFASVPGGVLQFRREDGLALRGAIFVMLVAAALLLPEGRFIAWQIDRWMQRDSRIAAFVAGGIVVGIAALVVVSAP